jgi:outer membrane biosynthesis protein TonB
MKLISIIGVIVIALFFGALITCNAQERSISASEGARNADMVIGFRCSDGEPNQPRPEIRMRVGDITRRALELPQPQYPPLLNGARGQGRVRAEVVIDVHTGEVVWTRIIEGHPLLREAVRRVACRARFRPSLINSPPIGVSSILTYRFPRRR